ncbi:multisubstrate pseudouridine synthase 7 [Coemansia aciculifera]|uniref:Multisubstrate pseudouridine synthase 7 n=1 Tax=Coemansia aciculifera TaxID=417176 RepID=A0A9W8M1A9_9FUNG|nr:multisubstrate pseudouridine synthase 7 [Coemansia aciculifera]
MLSPSSQDQASAKRSRAESPAADAQQTASSAEDVTTKRAKNEEEEEEEDEKHHFLRESDVGITQFVTAGWDGFDAIIKHRFSDFFVNEIDPSGNVVRLTSYYDVVDPTPPMSEEQKAIANLNVPDDAALAFDAAFVKLAEILGEEDSARIRQLLESEDGEQCSFVLDRELDKSQRKNVYNVTNNFLPTQVKCETVDGKLEFVRRNSGKRTNEGTQRRANRGQNWPHDGDFCYFVMQKENHDTMDVLFQIARSLRSTTRSLGMAGTKDKRGITVQRCSAYRIDHKRLIGASRNLKGARLGNFSYGPRELRLGDLSGNRFEIILRHVKGADEQSLAPVLEGIHRTGFINYYGMQRFGTQSISSHSVGIAVLKADWQAATELILKPRPGDRKEVRKARAVWSETRDARAALELMPQKAALAEHSVLQVFSRKGSENNAASAFAAVPRNLRLMYVHAYQSYVWNAATSQRLARFGIGGPVVGDLVIKAPGFGVKISGATDSVPGANGGEDSADVSSRIEPTLVTAQNIKQFTIYDVVLPLPGWAVTYPEHEVKKVYIDLMKQDGLSPFGLGKHPLKEYKLAGAYRHMVIKPRDFEYEWIRYNDDALPLARSDSDAIEGKHVPEGIEFGEHVALKLKFDLPSSAYATMLLRELMRQETAAGHQTKLSGNAGL